MDFNFFLRYWSLTLAVFIIYAFAFLAALVDVSAELGEEIRKRRAARAGKRVSAANPLAGRTIAQTLDSPGQTLDAMRLWVHGQVMPVLDELKIKGRALVLEDSMHHPFIQISDGRRVATYRINKEAVEKGRAGDPQKIQEVKDYLRRHLAADFLGRESERPPRTTELAREAASKPAPAARSAPAGPAATPPSDSAQRPPSDSAQRPPEES